MISKSSFGRTHFKFWFSFGFIKPSHSLDKYKKIITENSFVTNALTQNENHLQKLFNDQGINLEFSANDDSQYFGSKNSFNKNPNNNDQSNSPKSDNEQEQPNILKSLDDNVSSRHIVNVIA